LTALWLVSTALAADPPREGPWLRAAISFAMVPESYHLRTDAPDVPDGISYTNPAFTGGLEIRGLAWVPTRSAPDGGPWGAEVSWKGFAEMIDLEGLTTREDSDTAYASFVNSLVVGARYRWEVRPLVDAYLGLGIQRTTTPLFRYTDDSAAGRPDLLRIPVTGERLTAGLLWARDDLYADVALAQTLAILQPVDLALSAAGEYRLGSTVAARVALGLDWRTIHFEVVDDDAHVRVIETSILFGVSYLRF
jgi:hypothetical protein